LFEIIIYKYRVQTDSYKCQIKLMVTVYYTNTGCDFTLFIVLKQMYFIYLVLKMYTFEMI